MANVLEVPVKVARRRATQRRYYAAHQAIYRECQRRYLTRHPWQNIYKGIKSRCNNPHDKNYFYYGAQGIECRLTLQDVKCLWERDRADRLHQPSIDRIDPYGHYSIENCRFIEHRENCARQVRKIKRSGKTAGTQESTSP